MKRQILGFSLIILSLIFWGLITNIPLSLLGIKSLFIGLAILFIASVIFWVGAFLVGKEIAQKYRFPTKSRSRLNLKPGSIVRIG